MSSLGKSSTASASIEQPPPNPVNSDDPAWKYSTLPDTSKKNALQCNFCGKICTNGVTRLKFHLACIKGFNVKPCPKVPTDVMQEMVKFLLASSDANCKKVEALEKLRSTVNLDHSEGEETDEDDNNALVVLKPKPSSAASTSSHKGGSINKFFKPSSVEESVKKKSLGEKTQMKLSTQERELKRNRACEYICQWFYEASIPHNAVTLPSFACMLEQVHAKKRSRLRSDRLNDLVFVRVNSRLIDKKENKRRDPIEKIIEDVLEDEENEFITGIVPEDNVPVEQEQPDIEPEASTSQAQSVRHAHVRKKRKKSIHALLNAVPEDAVLSESSDSSSSEREGNQSQPDVLISDASSDSD